MGEAKGPRYRLPRLVRLLATGRPTMAELCAVLETGRRTVELDLAALENGGIQIEREAITGEGRPGRPSYRYSLAVETRRELAGRSG